MWKRILMALLMIVVAGVAILFWLGTREHNAQPATARASVDPAQLIERGRYLALVGNCMGCHTATGGKAYAGGRALPTPFGTFYGPNLTSDVETGIGKWSADDFWQALHNGKRPDGSLLYPAFPYPTYTTISRADADALYAYLHALPPVVQESRRHDLDFPYDQRVLIAGWRALYFRPEAQPALPTDGQTPEWGRGRYLVDGLAHCAECHTPRNGLGALKKDAGMAGAIIPGQSWYAPPLTADAATGLGSWTAEDIAELLKTGISRRGSSSGPMAEAVHLGFQHANDDDLKAMAVYLKSLPAAGVDAIAAKAPAPTATVMEAGGKIYAAQCVQCHQAAGEGIYPAWPPLAGNVSVTAPEAVNAIKLVLDGGFSPSTEGNRQPHGMPPFGQLLKDEEVAAVVSYIRNSWGNRAGAVSMPDVRRVREAR